MNRSPRGLTAPPEEVRGSEPAAGEALASPKAPTLRDGGTRRMETTATNGDTVWRQYLQISQVNNTIYVDEGNGSVSAK